VEREAFTNIRRVEPECTDVVVVRCRRCGDTFAVHEGEEAECRSCGGGELDPAAEPLL